MRIGVPREIKSHEYRVGLVPSSVRELVHQFKYERRLHLRGQPRGLNHETILRVEIRRPRV